MRLEEVSPEQGKAAYMYHGRVVEQYDLVAYDNIVIASLTKEEYENYNFMWFSVIDGRCSEIGEEIDFEKAKGEFLRIVEDDLIDKINYNTELLEALKEVEE